MSVRPNVIRESLEAMRKQAAGIEKPLLEAGAWSTRKHRVAFRHQGKLLEPIAGQFLMDFSEREKVVTTTPVPRSEPTPHEHEISVLFARGIALEENPSTQPEAMAAYHKVLELEPTHAAAHINLGHAVLQSPGIRAMRKSTTAAPSNPMPVMHSPISIWATFSTKPDGCRKRCRPTRSRSNWLPLTPTHITISHSPTRSCVSPAKLSSTGKPTSGSIHRVPGPSMRAARSSGFCNRMG